MNRSSVKGVAMLELAIILPLLLTIFFGIVEVGRALYQQHILTKTTSNTVRMLARTYETIDVESSCALQGTWSASLVDAENLLKYGDVDGGTEMLLENMQVSAVEVFEKSLDGFSKSFCTIKISAQATFKPLVSDALLGFPEFELRAFAEERYIGE